MAPSDPNLYLAASVSCLTAALFGYSVGFIGGEIVLPSFLNHFGLDHLPATELANARSAAVSAWIVGALIGVPAAMPVCSRLGRRLCLAFSGLLYVVGAVMQVASAGNLAIFDVGRLINGMGVGAGTLVSPIYISEISPADLRGMLMSGYQVFVQTGALIGFWMAYIAQAALPDDGALQWQVPVAMQLIAGGILSLSCLAIPDSPLYLAQKGRDAAVEKALAWLRRREPGDPELLKERLEVQAAINFDSKAQQQSLWRELVTRKDVRKRLHVGVGLMVSQQVVGFNALNYYAALIMMSAGFTSVSASLLLTGLFGLVKLIASLAFMFYFVRVKTNRFWLLIGSAICGIAMFVLAYCIYLTPAVAQTGSAVALTGITSVLMLYIIAFAFSISLGPISWNVCAEIFPLHINSTCCAITTCTQWAFQIVIAAVTPPLMARLGWATWAIYGGFCVLVLFWAAAVVPETRGVGLGKPMDELFGADQTTVTERGEEDALLEVSETTALLVHHERRRRSSLAAYA